MWLEVKTTTDNVKQVKKFVVELRCPVRGIDGVER
jgi:hypothetical protein